MADTQDVQVFITKQLSKTVDEKPFLGEIEVIKVILLNQTSSESQLVRNFAGETEDGARNGTSTNLWATWRLILDAAKSFPYAHAGLIKLVLGLQQLPDVVVSINGQSQAFQGINGEILWRNLPTLQASLREEVYNYGE